MIFERVPPCQEAIRRPFGLVFRIVGAAAGFESEWDATAPTHSQTEAMCPAHITDIPQQQRAAVEKAAIERVTVVIPPQTTPANVVPMRPGVFDQRPFVQPTAATAMPRRRFGEWPIVVTMVGVAVALAITVVDAFRTGAFVLGAVLCLAAVFRLVLTDADAGMIKSRSRPVDLAVIGAFAVAMLAIAAWIPPPA